jgi:hypothetical protein
LIVARHDFSLFLLGLVLLRLGEGGNTRWIGAAHRLARDIPADGEFFAVPVLTGRQIQETGSIIVACRR